MGYMLRRFLPLLLTLAAALPTAAGMFAQEVEKRDTLDTSYVTAVREKMRNTTQTGLMHIDGEKLRSGIALFGSPDIIKQLQTLPGVAAGNELYYHVWPKDEKHYYEIDFLLSRSNKIRPIEVKSSGYNSHVSLDAFCMKYSSRIGERILLYTKDYQQDGETTCVPVYFTPSSLYSEKLVKLWDTI